MPFKKGQSGNPAGKKKGSTNRFTDLKTSFLSVYQRLGGDDALLKWAQDDPRNQSTFYIMLKSMLPKEIQQEVKGNIHISWAGQDQIPDAEVVTPELTEGKAE